LSAASGTTKTPEPYTAKLHTLIVWLYDPDIVRERNLMSNPVQHEFRVCWFSKGLLSGILSLKTGEYSEQMITPSVIMSFNFQPKKI
jgi:hypothetical protein